MKTLLTIILILVSSQIFAEDFCDQSKMGGIPLPFTQDGKFIDNCVPEYLYSWQSHKHLISAKNNSNGKELFNKPYIYLFRTPVGTVGYGTAVLEIKVKPNIKWQFRRDRYNCSGAKEEKNTIYVQFESDWSGRVDWSEYLICHHDAIESWSFGTSEIKEKMKMEYKFVKKQNKDPKKYDWFVSPKNQLFRCDECWLGYYPWDTAKAGWLDSGMTDRLNTIDSLIANNEGGIFASNEESVQDHNTYERPTYFLPSQYNKNAKINSTQTIFKENITGEATAKAAAFCDNKNECNYKVSPKFINDPAKDLPKSFRISWTCDAKTDVKEIFVKADATDEILKLTCDKSEKIKIMSASFGENLIEGINTDFEENITNSCIGTNPCIIKEVYDGPKEASSSFWLEVSYKCDNAPSKSLTSKIRVNDGYFTGTIYCPK